MRTAAVVVDWRRPVETVEALRSLAAMKPPADVLICVENGCAPEDSKVVRKAAPHSTEFINSPRNIGFAAAVNLGIQKALHSGTDWVLLLNNDAVAAPGCLGRCLEDAATNIRVAAVGPAIAFTDRPDRLWFGGGQVSEWFAFTRHRGLMGSAAKPPPTGDTSFVTGCCMLISTAAWKNIGPFRSDFFAYYEDAEWCQRARASGWRCRYVGEVLCLHAVSVSSSQRNSILLSENTAYYLARNPIRFALDTTQWTHRLSRVLGLMVVWNTYNAWRLLRGRSISAVSAYVTGLVDAFRGRMGPRVEQVADRRAETANIP